MKTISKFKFIFCLILAIVCGISFLPTFSLKTFATQTVFENEILSDANFTMTMSATARKRNITLYRNVQTISNSVGEEISFLCFNWRELDTLNFNFSANIASSTKKFTSMKFVVTYLESETLDASIGVNEPHQPPLYQTTIQNNIFNNIDFYYHIDKSNTAIGTTHSNGNDFGLYKFDCIYSYQQDGEEIEVSLNEGLYIAVMPDKVEEIVENNVKILYSISSSNKLMNVFNLYLSNDDYKYVNPSRLQWNVVGRDKSNINYVLTKKIQEENIDSYANYKFIYESLNSITGNNFIFDSKDIEGTWTVYCTIKNSDGSIKNILQVSDLSTVKQEKKSYIWLILLIISICVLLAGIITLIIFRKKRDKVW